MRLYNKTVIDHQDLGLLSGELPLLLFDTTEKPVIKWNGAKFPTKLLVQCVEFSRYCYDKYGGEVQGRLYYSDKKKEWAIFIKTQYISRSLESKEKDCEDAPDLPSDFVYNGTWHSHAAANAFCSGTDHSNEIKQNGFHFTIGNVNMDVVSLHLRYSFRGLMYEIDSDIFESIDIKQPKFKKVKFPESWKDKLEEAPPSQQVTSWGWYGGNNVIKSSAPQAPEMFNDDLDELQEMLLENISVHAFGDDSVSHKSFILSAMREQFQATMDEELIAYVKALYFMMFQIAPTDEELFVICKKIYSKIETEKQIERYQKHMSLCDQLEFNTEYDVIEY